MMQHHTSLPPSQPYPIHQNAFLPPSQQVQSPWTLNLPSGPFLHPPRVYTPTIAPYNQSHQAYTQEPASQTASATASTPAHNPLYPPPSPSQPSFAPSSMQQQTLLTQPYPQSQTPRQTQPRFSSVGYRQPSCTPQSQDSHPPVIPASSSRVRVDSYRPTASTSSARSAEDVYKEDREKQMTKSERILNKLCEISGQMITLQGDLSTVKDNNRQLHADLTTFKNENRQLRDQIHDLQLGQRALATRDEVTEDMVNHITPLLNDQTQNHIDRINEMQTVLPDTMATKIDAKLQGILGRSQGLTTPLNQRSFEALTGLVDGLSAKVDVVERLVNSLQHLEELPEALTYVIGLKDSIKYLDQTVHHPPAPLTAPVEIHPASHLSADPTANFGIPTVLLDELQQAIQAVYAARDAFEYQRAQPQSVVELLQSITTDPNVRALLQQLLAVTDQSTATFPHYENHQAASSLDTLAQVAVSRQATSRTSNTPEPFRLMTPVSYEPIMQADQPGNNTENAQFNPPRSSTPTESDVFGPVVGVPPAFENSKLSPLASRRYAGAGTTSLLYPLTSGHTVPTSVPRPSATPKSKTSTASDGKKKSSHELVSGSRRTSSHKKPLDPTDRPFTRSMSTKAPPRRADTGNGPGASSEHPIEISSGSSGASPPDVRQENNSEESFPPRVSTPAKTRRDEGESAAFIDQQQQDAGNGIDSQTEAGSFPSEPKPRPQPLKTYGSRSTTTLFGSQMSATSSMGGSRKRMKSSLAAEMDRGHVRHKRSSIADQTSRRTVTSGASQQANRSNKRTIFTNEDEGSMG
ncbi:hypothetical protein IAT40_002621 [Kwoniella sp. CBS 6097]